MGKGADRKLGTRERQKDLIQKGEANRQAAIYESDPLKQYIRRFGWIDVIKDYQSRMHQDQVDRGLKILTLPGKNATDIGLFFKEGIVYVENQILNVAICDIENAAIVQANLAALGSLLAISNKNLSKTLKEDKQFINLFPFDVINLDFCDHLFGLSDDDNLTALEAIFHLQRGQGFLLLLTNRCNSQQNEQQRLQAESIMTANLTIDSFRQAYARRYGGEGLDLCMGNQVALTQTIYPKVVARLARDFGYQVNEKFAAHYSRDGGAYHMVCHSLELLPLDRLNENLKYSPNMKRTNSVVIDRVVYEPSDNVRKHSSQEYERFVSQIVERETQDIDQIINTNRNLNDDLQSEVSSLSDWWEHINIGVN